MTDKLILNAAVTYADVDRDEVMLLPRVFKLLQEAAILHANQFGTGTKAMAAREETWVLNRMEVAIERYPRHDEALRVETWSNGIKGFKGLRDFRVYDAGQQAIIRATSFWLYISVKTKSIVRVPREIVESFPVCLEGACFPDLEKTPFESPGVDASTVFLTLRYSDIDVNEHVNNSAYLDLLQTALAQNGHEVRPRRVRLKYAKAIPAGTTSVNVRLDPRGSPVTRFRIEGAEAVFAEGEVSAAGA